MRGDHGSENIIKVQTGVTYTIINVTDTAIIATYTIIVMTDALTTRILSKCKIIVNY